MNKLLNEFKSPQIIPKPDYISGIEDNIINLNGNWKFTLNPPIKAYENNVNFSNWDDVKVPGELLMQGHNIIMEKEYFYKKKINIPTEFINKKIILRFEGVYTKCRVWIDGNFIREHRGGFTPFDCDITDYATPGKEVIITVGIIDTKEAPSHGSLYAHHCIGGILRDVSLIAVNKDYINRTYIETDLDKNYKNAILKVGIGLSINSSDITNQIFKIELELLDINGKQIATRKQDVTNIQQEIILNTDIPVNSPILWDAEHPYLYTLQVTLYKGDLKLQLNDEKVGFRKIIFGGKDGTDKNKVYVNGKEVKLRGTCRHDVTYNLGRSTTPVLDEDEIKTYKEYNINYIRTSHYPPTKKLIEMCDRYGIYVECETATCFVGEGFSPVPDADYILNPFKEMLEYNYNHPSIIIWSLANESHWNTSPAFAQEYDYIKEFDKTRLIKFSWQRFVQPNYPMDLFSEHYAAYGTPLGKSNIPVIHDEYAHIACYNLDELSRDLNVRNFWGHSVKGFWEQMFETNGALGGAIWGGIDDVFMIPDGTVPLAKKSNGSAVGYGEWGCIFDIYRRLKPEAWLVKKGYSPIRIDEENIKNPGDGKDLVIPIKNWFDHTNLNEITLKWSVKGQSGKMKLPDIKPHLSGYFVIPKRNWKNDDILNLNFYSNYLGIEIMIDTFNVELGKREVIFKEPIQNSLNVVKDKGKYIIKGDTFEISINESTGLISDGKYSNKTIIKSGPYLHLIGSELGAWILKDFSVDAGSDIVMIRTRGSYGSLEVRLQININKSGQIKTSYEILSNPSVNKGYSEIGIYYEILGDINQARWSRKGLYSAYPDNHIGRNEGIAVKERKGSELYPDKYRENTNWDWYNSMRDFFIYNKNDKSDGLVTYDFKSMRENIYYYKTEFENEEGKILVASNGNQAARVEVSKTKYNMIDDRDSKIKYTGKWNTFNSPRDYNGTETYSEEYGASAQLEFNGIGIVFVGSKQKNTGDVNIYIDGVFKEKVNTYNNLGEELKQSIIYKIENLPLGKHTIKVEAAGGNSNIIVVDAFEILGYNEVVVDDRDSRVKYKGSWERYIDEEDYDKTETFSKSYGSTAELVFSGVGVKFIGSKQDNTGNVNIYIDGKFKATVNTYIESKVQQKQVVIYDIQGLEDTNHTIKVEAGGGSSNIIVVDAFEISTALGDGYTENAKLIINTKWNYPSLAWGNYLKPPQTLNKGDVIDATIYLNNEVNIITNYTSK